MTEVYRTAAALADQCPENQDVKLRQKHGIGKTVLYLAKQMFIHAFKNR